MPGNAQEDTYLEVVTGLAEKNCVVASPEGQQGLEFAGEAFGV